MSKALPKWVVNLFHKSCQGIWLLCQVFLIVWATLAIHYSNLPWKLFRPEFYHLLQNSCTVNIVRYANPVGRKGGFDYRHWLNGLVDRYLYEKGYLDTSLPFSELRRRSRINEAAQAADQAADFSERIRASLPTPHL